jgi:hypothetical protein
MKIANYGYAALTLALALSFHPSMAHAQSSVQLSCATDSCQANAIGTGITKPVKYSWSFTGVAHLITGPGGKTPFDSCNRFGGAVCNFECYAPYQDHIVVHVSAVDSNGSFIGSASAGTVCNLSPL